MADRRGAGRRPVDRTRRRFARRQWARRWLTWRYAVAGVLLVLAVGFGVYALYFSSWLRVEGAEVVGASQVAEERVLAYAEVPQGDALAAVDLEAIERRVAALDAVKAVDVSRQWPHDVRIEIVERQPVAVMDRGDGLSYLDEDGQPFRPDGQPVRQVPDRLPLVEFGQDADEAAREEAAAVVTSLPDDVAVLVHHVQVDSVDRIVLFLRDGREVRWGSADQSEEKAEVLIPLLERDAKVYDVSVPGLPTTRP